MLVKKTFACFLKRLIWIWKAPVKSKDISRFLLKFYKTDFFYLKCLIIFNLNDLYSKSYNLTYKWAGRLKFMPLFIDLEFFMYKRKKVKVN